MRVLITGGAGYIGSHAVLSAIEAGFDVSVVDNLSTGDVRILSNHAKFFNHDLSDISAIASIIKKEKIDTIMHFAAKTVVPDSFLEPFKYYTENTANTLTLLRSAANHGVKNFIFSSTAAVYGNSALEMVSEDAPTYPISPYGKSKLASEWLISDIANENNIKFLIFRYFNVAGADPFMRTGPISKSSNHLIKVALDVLRKKRNFLPVYGSDYPTFDGSCIRDFIHVSDLADAHTDGVRYLMNGGSNLILNCGYGLGYSVFQVIETINKLYGVELPVHISSRRAGDIPSITADNSLITKKLNWKPKWSKLSDIIQHAYQWEEFFSQI